MPQALRSAPGSQLLSSGVNDRGVVGVAEDMPRLEPGSCAQTPYIEVPAPIEVVDMQALERAHRALAIALRILRDEPVLADAVLEAGLESKAYQVAQLLRERCSDDGCIRSADDE